VAEHFSKTVACKFVRIVHPELVAVVVGHHTHLFVFKFEIEAVHLERVCARGLHENATFAEG
jgi:hypothetical protein